MVAVEVVVFLSMVMLVVAGMGERLSETKFSVSLFPVIIVVSNLAINKSVYKPLLLAFTKVVEPKAIVGLKKYPVT